ncbi:MULTISPECIES: patatin-like phospholipase family protein [Dyella]|uniref:Cyclic nucleotide-binding domain-containing protein n=2 Tax=Dyella TaxID=231454 RepID=A0A4R0YPR9_9GAMM|nr:MULTISPECIES: patatin-like phospholipase family protein [Dyella]TBR35901.1 cyclic nucleotide-binding domain-containing protein [Dyella terrae]TCI08551.1 cyclic nucleotide-binding domain-containing protein [Dyella soli]
MTADFTEWLRQSDVFGHLEPDALAALHAQLVWFSLPGGRPLFKRGEPGNAMYLLVSGALGTFDGPTELTRLVSAGESVGEVGLISGEVRQGTVRALRDSELLRLDRAAFEQLVSDFPHAMLGAARVAIARLQQRLRGDEDPGAPRTFAMLPVDPGVPARTLAMQLAMALEPYGSCLVIDGEHGTGKGSDWFAEREAQAQFVIYLDTQGDRLWRQRCLRQADVLLLPALAAQTARPWPEVTPLHPSHAGHRPRHLILLHPGRQPSLGSAHRWRAQFSGELQHHHVGHQADIERLARRVSGNGRGLVLAGGGARGLAHLGALKAFAEAGMSFDAVGGTSIGAIIGAGVAAGWDVDTMTETFRRAFVEGRPLSDWTLPLVALTRGRRAALTLRQAFGALDIEDLNLPFFCITTCLSGDGMVAQRHGPLWLWLRASSAIPGVLPPVLHHGRVYIDGALMDNLPTDVMAADGMAHVTAVDIRAEISLLTNAEEYATPPWWRLLSRRGGIQRPGLVSTLVRAAMVNSEESSERRRERADLLVTPPLEHIGMLDWKDWQRAVEAGYEATVKQLER